MKKMIFLMLTLLIMGVASMNAQVKIGGDPETEVTTGAVLELDGASGALLLPRVDVLPTAENSAAGMQVYLTTNNKVYTYDGSTWVAEVSGEQVTSQINANKQASVGSAVAAGIADKLSQARRIILTGDVIGEVSFDGSGEAIIHTTIADPTGVARIAIQPTAFSFTRLYDIAGDPGMTPTTGTLNGPKLTVVANGANPTYQWQWRKSPATEWTDATATEGTGFNTASFTPKYTVGVDNWGLYEYQCIVSTADPSANVTSATAQVAAGCGAKTSTGWLRFMCQNLGAANIPATTSLDNIPTLVISGTRNTVPNGSEDAKGWMFQWGRAADGHQLRNSSVTKVQDVTPWMSATNESSNLFVSGFGSWRANPAPDDDPYAVADPCPLNWRITVAQDWGNIFRGSTGGYGVIYGTRNTWLRRADAVLIKEIGSKTTTLHLPNTGIMQDLWIWGAELNYWNRDTRDNGGSMMIVNDLDVSPGYKIARASGAAIRCVAD